MISKNLIAKLLLFTALFPVTPTIALLVSFFM